MNEKYMKEAIKQAKKAASIGEVPIGCVIVYKDKIIGRGYNRRMTDKNALSHAELNAIKKAKYLDEKIVKGTLEDIAQKVRENNIRKTALILVGRFLGKEYKNSKLYDKDFKHEYRG